MKLRNILIAAATMGVMFASADRTNILGYTAGDYSDMNTFPQNATNVAYTTGNDFNLVWSDGGTTWGFSGSQCDECGDDLVNMLWSNGSMGFTLGVNMDSGTAGVTEVPDLGDCGETGDQPCGDGTAGVAEVAGETTMDIGFGMNLAGWDVGFSMGTAEGADMTLNARGNLGFWAFDTMTFGYESNDDYSHIDVNMYGVKEWGAATGMFAMGFESTDKFDDFGDESAMLLTTGFSVESTLTDWCDLRLGYDRKFNMAPDAGGETSWDVFHAGVGFNLGSVQLDMTLANDDDSGNVLDSMMSNPLNYISGYAGGDLTASWTLSYTW